MVSRKSFRACQAGYKAIGTNVYGLREFPMKGDIALLNYSFSAYCTLMRTQIDNRNNRRSQLGRQFLPCVDQPFQFRIGRSVLAL